MFSLKKSNLPRPLAWVRRKVGSRSRRSVDVERRESSVISVATLDASASSPRSENEIRGSVTVTWPGKSITSGKAIGSSQSEPAIGPYSNPDDFCLAPETGSVIKKAKSVGAMKTGTTSPKLRGRKARQKQFEETLGVRRRLGKYAKGTGNGSSHARSAVNGAMLNQQANATGASNGIGGIGLVTMNEGTPAAAEGQAVSRPYYLHAFFDIMYLTGTSRRVPRDFRGRKKCSAQLSRIFFMMVFCGINILSNWDSMNQGKLSGFNFMSGEGMSFFMEFCFFLFCLLTKLYSFCRFTFLNEQTDKLLDTIADYDRKYDPQDHCHCNYWKIIIFAMCMGTLVTSVAATLFERGFEDWSLESFARDKSYEFSQHVFIWAYRNMTTRESELAQSYGKPNSYRVDYAIMSCALNISSYFQMGSLRDLALVGVFVVFVIVIAFMKGIKDTTENAPKSDIRACRALRARREQLWKQYRKLKVVIALFNNVFDTLLVLLHVDNLLLSGFFAAMFIDIERNDLGAIFYFDCAFNLAKAELTYLLAGRISAQNDLLRTWLRNWAFNSGKIVIEGQDYDLGAMLDELDKEPIMIGTGAFKINVEFHLKYLGFVGSLVLFLADDKKTMNEFPLCRMHAD